MSNNSSDTTYTLQEFISSKPITEITYDSLSIFQLIGQTYLITRNILDDYRDEIMSITKKVKLDDDQYNKYYQSPQLLAYDIYGSTELDYIILFTNKICDIKDFNKNVIRLLAPDNVTEVLTEIYRSEEKLLTRLRKKINQ